MYNMQVNMLRSEICKIICQQYAEYVKNHTNKYAEYAEYEILYANIMVWAEEYLEKSSKYTVKDANIVHKMHNMQKNPH